MLQPGAFPSIAACVGTGQAQVWAKLDISQLQRQNLILPLKVWGGEAHVAWEGDGGDRSWAMSFCSNWSKKDVGGNLRGNSRRLQDTSSSDTDDRAIVAWFSIKPHRFHYQCRFGFSTNIYKTHNHMDSNHISRCCHSVLPCYCTAYPSREDAVKERVKVWPIWFIPLSPRSSARGSRGAGIALRSLPVQILWCTKSVCLKETGVFSHPSIFPGTRASCFPLQSHWGESFWIYTTSGSRCDWCIDTVESEVVA